MLLLGPVAIASAILAVAAVAKLKDPWAAQEVLRVLRLPGRLGAVRVLAAIELTVGVFAIIYGGRWSALGVTGLFAGFTVVSVVLRHRSGDVSCGCFGGLSARVRPLHVAANAVLTMVSLAAVVWPVPGLVADHGRLPGHGVPDAVLVVAGAIIAVAIFGPYSALRDARSPNRPVRTQP